VEDREILDCIHALAAEQHRLRHSDDPSQDERIRRERIQQLEESLAQLWDLLRRCRAAQAESVEPDEIDLRDAVQA